LGQPEDPFFCGSEGPVDECFAEIDFPSLTKVVSKHLQGANDSSFFNPCLESTVTGLIRRIITWKVFPSRTRLQDPQDTVENIACWHRRTTGFAGSVILGEQRRDHLPLLFGQFHPDLRS
jgi:hypothetical protein